MCPAGQISPGKMEVPCVGDLRLPGSQPEVLELCNIQLIPTGPDCPGRDRSSGRSARYCNCQCEAKPGPMRMKAEFYPD